jgi:pimeloyl-ACP methyl ester carboxylesterase
MRNRSTARHRITVAAIGMGLLLAGCQPKDGALARKVDIGGGRSMYLECRGSGSPTVVLVSGLDAAADLWHREDQPDPKVFPSVGAFTRVCAYDRPGTPTGSGKPSRSDPVPQPVTPEDGVRDLHALLGAAAVPGPYVLVAHSYGGLIGRLFASTFPDEVAGLVLVDNLSEGLQDGMSAEEWETWKKANARPAASIAEYPALERFEEDRTMDQLRAAPPIRPMPLAVLSADFLYGPLIPTMIAAGAVSTDTPPDLGYVIDRANAQAQAKLAQLVPGARHVTETHSGHDIMIDQPKLVTDTIRDVVDAARRGDTKLQH